VVADDAEVPNPKDGNAPALDQYKSIGDQLLQAYEQSGQYHVSAWRDDTIVEAAELPVYMLVQGVESMQKVHDTAEEISEEEKKQMILLFITGILGFIPVAGGGLASLGLTTLGRIIRIVGGVGDAAFDLYGVVEDPSSAIFAVFGAFANVKDFGQASGPARTMMNAGQQEKLGPTVKSKTDTDDLRGKSGRTE
jgi:chitinase